MFSKIFFDRFDGCLNLPRCMGPCMRLKGDILKRTASEKQKFQKILLYGHVGGICFVFLIFFRNWEFHNFKPAMHYLRITTKRRKVGETRTACRLLFVISVNLFFVGEAVFWRNSKGIFVDKKNWLCHLHIKQFSSEWMTNKRIVCRRLFIVHRLVLLKHIFSPKNWIVYSEL